MSSVGSLLIAVSCCLVTAAHADSCVAAATGADNAVLNYGVISNGVLVAVLDRVSIILIPISAMRTTPPTSNLCSTCQVRICAPPKKTRRRSNTAPPKSTPHQDRSSAPPAGRRRLSEAMKKRWAEGRKKAKSPSLRPRLFQAPSVIAVAHIYIRVLDRSVDAHPPSYSHTG